MAVDQGTGLTEALVEVVGPQFVNDRRFARIPYSRDGGIWSKGVLPDVIVRPGSIEDVQGVLAVANQTKTPLYVRGAFTSPFGYYPKEGGIVMDMTRMNKLLDINEESLTCRAEPGLTFGELEAALYPRGFTYLVSPEGALGGTVGGHASNRGSSPMCVLVSNQGECVMGLKVVLPTGEVVATGSMANPNAHSQFLRYSFMNDLTGLFVGSEGTLGVIVDVALKIEELPEAEGNAAYAFDTIEDAGKAMYLARRKRIPASACLLHDGEMMDIIDPGKAPHEPYIVSWARIGGPPAVVDEALKTLANIARESGGTDLGAGIPARYWHERYRAVAGFLYTLGGRMGYHWLVPIGEVPYYYNKAKEIAREIMAETGIKATVAGHPADRAFVILFSLNCHEYDEAERQMARELHRAVRGKLLDLGAAYYRSAVDYSSDLAPRTGNYYELIKRIKATVDPNHIMNPGFGGL